MFSDVVVALSEAILTTQRFLIFHTRSANDFIQISTSHELYCTTSTALQLEQFGVKSKFKVFL